ncbi:PhnE/PtxC family ABC transporter permease [Pantanalinema rosaneae]|uniref:PhnE/PtxC family ABC transporter permease n=1 Tax=Pantanalinema rosaneae TaxID=1620701 RepID=UPI003D6F6F89
MAGTKPPTLLTHSSFRWGLFAIVVIGLSLGQIGIGQRELFNPNGVGQLWQFVVASGQPDLSPDLLRLTADATLTTLAYAVCGTCLSVLLGCFGGLFCSEVWWSAIVPHSSHRFTSGWLITKALLAIPRAIHEVIWGLIFINIFGLDPLVAVLAIAIPFGAITAKIFAEIIDETPRQPFQALVGSGVAPLTALFYTLLPQAFLHLLSYVFYRFECSIRSAAVLGMIGAGGLGYEILLSLQSLRYPQLWTFFYALFLLNGAVDFISAWTRQQLGCPSRLDLNARKPLPPIARTGRQYRRLPIVLSLSLLGLISFCFWYIQADFRQLWSARTYRLLREMVRSSLPPDWSIVPQFLPLSLQTVAMSILAIVLAAVGGMLLSFPAAHNFFLPGGLLNRTGQGNRWLAWVGLLAARSLLLISRAIPAPVWALVVLFVTFPGILPGAIALGLHNLGILGRLKAEVIENLDQRPLEALKAQGTPSSLVWLYGVLPLTLTRFLAYDLYRWEVCMRETVIVGLVGAGGLGRLMMEQLSSFDYRALLPTLLGFIVLTFLVDWISATARRSLR